jgi:hypothetical protein
MWKHATVGADQLRCCSLDPAVVPCVGRGCRRKKSLSPQRSHHTPELHHGKQAHSPLPSRFSHGRGERREEGRRQGSTRKLPCVDMMDISHMFCPPVCYRYPFKASGGFGCPGGRVGGIVQIPATKALHLFSRRLLPHQESDGRACRGVGGVLMMEEGEEPARVGRSAAGWREVGRERGLRLPLSRVSMDPVWCDAQRLLPARAEEPLPREGADPVPNGEFRATLGKGDHETILSASQDMELSASKIYEPFEEEDESTDEPPLDSTAGGAHDNDDHDTPGLSVSSRDLTHTTDARRHAR